MTPKEKLKSILINRYNAKLQYNGVWHSISCPFCGDSPNPKTRHCNIRVSNDDDIIVVYCFQLKCRHSGIMRKEHLKLMGIHDKEIIDYIENHRHTSEDMMKRTYENVHGWDLPYEGHSIITNYFESRTKITLRNDIIDKFRIVISLSKFVELNKDRLGRTVISNIKKVWKRPYIAFLNRTGTNLELRAASKDVPKDKRFLKINLLEDNDMLRFIRHKPYAIEIDNDYNLCDSGYITIAEGKFDLINTVSHIMPECKGIWISTPTSGMKGIIREATKIYPYRNVVFICDSDVTDMDIKQIMKDIEYRVSSVTIVRNQASKDFGDMTEKISPIKYII